MGWDGYSLGLCKNGHKLGLDATEYMFSEEKILCHWCQQEVVWEITVDQTNGENQGEITDEGWRSLLVTPEKSETCNLGHVHVTEQAIYRIPTKEETEKLRVYYGPDGVPE